MHARLLAAQRIASLTASGITKSLPDKSRSFRITARTISAHRNILAKQSPTGIAAHLILILCKYMVNELNPRNLSPIGSNVLN